MIRRHFKIRSAECALRNLEAKGPHPQDLRIRTLSLVVGGTGIEICPFQEKCGTFKEFQALQAQIHNPFIRRVIRTTDCLVNEEEWNGRIKRTDLTMRLPPKLKAKEMRILRFKFHLLSGGESDAKSRIRI